MKGRRKAKWKEPINTVWSEQVINDIQVILSWGCLQQFLEGVHLKPRTNPEGTKPQQKK